MRALLSSLVVVGLLACSGNSSSANRAQEQLAALQKKKEADAKARREKDEQPVALPDVVKLDAPYDDTQATVIIPDGPCPEGFWALFGDVPGATVDEKRQNAANKKQLAEALRQKTYLIKLRGAQVSLSPYDAPKGRFGIDVAGTVDCTDSIGRIAIAWSAVKAGDPGASAAKEGSEFVQNVWQAEPVHFELPITSLTEAKAFESKNRFGLSARVGFTLGKAEVDKKLRRVAKVQEKAAGETLSFGGGTEDWGAGRLIKADVLGLRVAIDREKTQLFEKTK